MHGRVLVIAGSDSGGGAGIQADIKTITALGGYAMTAITALTAQDTTGVHGIYPVPPEFVVQQIECVLADIGADVVKIGMLGDVAVIEAVVSALERWARDVPVVLDPVMIAKGGAELLADSAVGHLKRRLLPLAHVLTPNVPEAEALAGTTISGIDDMRATASMLLTLGVPAVLLKGGHLPGPEVIDLLATHADPGIIDIESFHGSRLDTAHTHGTGCTLASAVATGLAQGLDLHEAVVRARAYVRAAIIAAPGFGHDHGPLDHTVWIDPIFAHREAARA